MAQARLVPLFLALALAAAGSSASAQDFRRPAQGVSEAPRGANMSLPPAPGENASAASTSPNGAVRPPARSMRVSVVPGAAPPAPAPWGAKQYPLRPEIWTPKRAYKFGEPIDFYFRCDEDAYIYVFNTDSSGHVSQIFPNFFDRANRARANEIYRLPPDGNAVGAYGFQATPPAGRETISILAVAAPYPETQAYQQPAFSAQEPYPASIPSPLATLAALERKAAQGGGNARLPGGMSVPAPGCRFGYSVLGLETRDPATMGELFVATVPGPALVFIDGYFEGETPLAVELPAGSHHVIAQREHFRDLEHTIEVPARRRATLAGPMEPIHPPIPADWGLVWVSSGPGLADIYADGQYMGKSPLAFAMPAGERELLLRKEGFRDDAFKIVVDPALPQTMARQLQPK